MKNNETLIKPVSWFWMVFALMLAISAFCPPMALSQVPGRFYWKTLANANATPLIFESLNGNTNPSTLLIR